MKVKIEEVQPGRYQGFAMFPGSVIWTPLTESNTNTLVIEKLLDIKVKAYFAQLEFNERRAQGKTTYKEWEVIRT